VVSGDLIAVRTACSAENSARVEAAESRTINIRNRTIDIFYSRIEAKRPTLNVERPMFNAVIPSKVEAATQRPTKSRSPGFQLLIKSIDNFAGSFDSASLRSGMTCDGSAAHVS
jgi:hypothetical protein